MPDDRQWMFNPGCPEAGCCEEEECGELCIEMTQGNPGSTSVGSGITVNGGTLGTIVTDSNGRACFDIDGPGDYTFTVSKTGYLPNTFTVTVESEDCDGTSIIKPGGNLLPDLPPDGCIDLYLWQCRWCPRPGITLTFTASGFTQTSVSQGDGLIRLCLPAGMSNSTVVSVTVPGDGGPQIDTVIAKTKSVWLSPPTGDDYYLFADRDVEWFCLPHPTSNHCMQPIPTQLTATFGPSWAVNLAGTTRTLTYFSQPSLIGEFLYRDQWQDAGGYYQLGVSLQWEHVNVCGNPNHAFATLTVATNSTSTPHTNMQFGYQVGYGTNSCPVNMKMNRVESGVQNPVNYFIVTE